MHFLKKLQEAIISNSSRNAFCIDEVFYTYYSFAIAISKIRKAIQQEICESQKNIGLVANDDLETYASIIALWFEGKTYVPLQSDAPVEWNKNIIIQIGIQSILDSSVKKLFSKYHSIETRELPTVDLNLEPKVTADQELAYILFTSGTTGIPKGVPISRDNLSGFISSYFSFVKNIHEQDSFLQMFELSFDASVMSYLPALLKGACLYTVPKNNVKFSYAIELLEKHQITVALMVPSVLQYGRPYFNEIICPSLKYSLLGGEALQADIVGQWSKCVPNATIINCYGPTEFTIVATHYTYQYVQNNKTYNGMLSIGKMPGGNIAIIVNEKNQIMQTGEKGELCLSGTQMITGYWNNSEKDKEAFFLFEYKEQPTRFYKTGDCCFMDDDGDIMYVERIDRQTKIQGHRVELTEIEFHAKAFLNNVNVVAIVLSNKFGNKEIMLILQSPEFDTADFYKYMRNKIPGYMIPTQTRFVKGIPHNTNGKIDREKLAYTFCVENNAGV